MKKNKYSEFKELVILFKTANFKENKDEIVILLKEYIRRQLLWIDTLQNEGLTLSITNLAFIDLAYELTGKQLDFQELEKVLDGLKFDAYHTDKKLLCAYFNFKDQEETIFNLGYKLPNPYSPFIEIFKRGGFALRHEYSQIYIHPGLVILMNPKSKYMGELPFWKEDIIGRSKFEEE